MSTEIEIVGYLRASPEGKPEWSEDCVCVDAVYPNYDGDESVSMPICRLADAKAIIDQLRAELAAPVDAGIELAARWVEQRANDYDAEHGSTDHETGYREYPGDGAEYYGELMEIAEGIRALLAQSQEVKP